MNVYLIRQDLTHLYGDTLVKAVVIAGSIPEAKQALVEHLENCLDSVVWDTGLWAIFKIGNNGKLPGSTSRYAVVCADVQTRDGLPPGNYTPKSKNNVAETIRR